MLEKIDKLAKWFVLVSCSSIFVAKVKETTNILT